MYLYWFVHSVISFMKIKNRRGPKIHPSGTPDALNNFRVRVYYVLYTYILFSICLIWVEPVQSYSSYTGILNFDSRISWLTQSNALRKSKNRKNTTSPESICFYMYCKKCNMPWVIHCLSRKPYCCLCKIELFSK